MTKSTAIATYLVTLNLAIDIQTAEKTVFDSFVCNFSVFNFHEWNTEIDTSSMNQLVESLDSSSDIDVNCLITGLWDT